jgi:hypothetical protein
LSGFRRDQAGDFEEWRPDDQGRLWSDVLGLYFVVQGMTVRAATREGELIPTVDEAVAKGEQDSAARSEADQEIERLRREIAKLRVRETAD